MTLGSLSQAEHLDAQDPLAAVRDQFELPADIIYLCGNSLGPLPTRVRDVMRDVVDRQWGEHLVSAWNRDQWWTAPERVGDALAPLLGAGPDQVLVTDSTSINLFKCYLAAKRLRPQRKLIVVDPGSFPTDLYMLAGAAKVADFTIVSATPAEIPEYLARHGADICLVSLSQVDYRTGQLWDLPQLTQKISSVGALSLWDLCHSAGVLSPHLDRHGVDFAVGCGYKYLNGGPGAPSFIYVARRHQEGLDQPLTGWHGHAQPFEMANSYVPAPGIRQLRVGSPAVLSLLALEAAVQLFDGIDPEQLWAKAQSLTEIFRQTVTASTPELELLTPVEPTQRGAQISFRHPQARAIVQFLADHGVIGDFRPPDVLRFGFSPLFLRHSDSHRAAELLSSVVSKKRYETVQEFSRGPVT